MSFRPMWLIIKLFYLKISKKAKYFSQSKDSRLLNFLNEDDFWRLRHFCLVDTFNISSLIAKHLFKPIISFDLYQFLFVGEVKSP